MLSKAIIESDAFLELGASARFLYVDLVMNADDDGFVNAPKKICRIVDATDADLAALIEKRFLLNFPEKGVVVIKHWWIHNSIPSDRHKPTKYQDILSNLYLDENKAYTLKAECNQRADSMYTDRLQTVTVSKDKLSKDKRSKEKKRIQRGENTPIYDDSSNPELNRERLAELMERRS